jgi:hypothetical protein
MSPKNVRRLFGKQEGQNIFWWILIVYFENAGARGGYPHPGGWSHSFTHASPIYCPGHGTKYIRGVLLVGCNGVLAHIPSMEELTMSSHVWSGASFAK